MGGELTIGRVAKQADVHVETIRYYQRRGLLSRPNRPLGGYRRYSPAIVRRIRFIKRAQALGFTLDEIAALLRLDEADTCAEHCDMAAQKIETIDGKLADLGAMREALAGLVAQCGATTADQPCPIIQALVRDQKTAVNGSKGKAG